MLILHTPSLQNCFLKIQFQSCHSLVQNLGWLLISQRVKQNPAFEALGCQHLHCLGSSLSTAVSSRTGPVVHAPGVLVYLPRAERGQTLLCWDLHLRVFRGMLFSRIFPSHWLTFNCELKYPPVQMHYPGRAHSFAIPCAESSWSPICKR